MLFPYHIHRHQFDGRSFWIAESDVLKGCAGQGNTRAEACEKLKQNELVWLQTAKELGIPIPSNQKKKEGEDDV